MEWRRLGGTTGHRRVRLALIALCLSALVTFALYLSEAEQARPAAGRRAASEKLICVDLRRRILILYEDRREVARYPVAVGKPESPSPAGVWRVVSKMEGWKECYGTRWMGLNVPWGSYGIHGTNQPGSIGCTLSLGCIRMLNEDVEELYPKVPMGTRVIVEDAYGLLPAKLRSIEPGARGSVVRVVQQKLRALGYYQGQADGIYGKRMEAAVCAFKRDCGMEESLSVGPMTYEALGLLPFE